MQRGSSHPSPPQPESHRQMGAAVPPPSAATHLPRPEHSSGQLGSLHETPRHPCRQRQLPGATHSPRRTSAPQSSSAQTGSVHRSPFQPSKHSHACTSPITELTVTLTAALELPLAPLLASVVMPFGTWMHRPCTQPATAVPSGIGAFAKQVGCSHAAPVHPSRHSHSPGLAHRPWLEQLAGQRGASHCAPLQPSKHEQPVSEQRPWPWHQSPAPQTRSKGCM